MLSSNWGDGCLTDTKPENKKVVYLKSFVTIIYWCRKFQYLINLFICRIWIQKLSFKYYDIIFNVCDSVVKWPVNMNITGWSKRKWNQMQTCQKQIIDKCNFFTNKKFLFFQNIPAKKNNIELIVIILQVPPPKALIFQNY